MEIMKTNFDKTIASLIKKLTTKAKVKTIRNYYQDGFNDMQVAVMLGVDASLYESALNSSVILQKAKQQGIELLKGRIIEKVTKLALGFYVEEEKRIYAPDKDTDVEKLIRREVTRKYIRPSEKAMEFWLTNVDSENWGKTDEKQSSNSKTDSDDLSLTPEQIKERLEKIKSRNKK